MAKQPGVPEQGYAALRGHVSNLLAGGDAHATFDDAVEGIPAVLRGVKPSGAPYSAWQVLEHMRLAQRDILDFSRNPEHVSPEWPSGYWPASEAPGDSQWEESIREFKSDLEAMRKLVSDGRRDLFAPVRHPQAEARHTLLREALLVADHNAYHVGELVLLRRLLGAWPA